MKSWRLSRRAAAAVFITAFCLCMTAGCRKTSQGGGGAASPSASAPSPQVSASASPQTSASPKASASISPSVTVSGGEAAEDIIYTNKQYGFTFKLPKDWKGYTIIDSKWQGVSTSGSSDGVTETGPEISIRNPGWTEAEPMQDIPIMVFTLDQWKSLQNDEFHIGAAPIGPSELGRNSKYVFALPARYNYAFPKGYEEVQNILEGNPLAPIEVTGS